MGIPKIVGTLLACWLAGAAWAFPDKQVTLVVPYPAGGAADSAARLVAARLQARWNQPVLVENRPGATGAIGTEHVIRSAPDGHTLLLQPAILISTEVTRPSVNYRTLRDLVPVSGVFTTPIVYLASDSAPAGDLKAVLNAGRSGQQLDFGSHGDGTVSHYLGEYLKRTTKVDMTHVPFAGDNPILTALLGGHLKTGFLSGANAKKAEATGKVRMLAVCSASRSPLLPQAPTFSELGIDGCDRDAWAKIFAPIRTPAAVVEIISEGIQAVLTQPEVRDRFAQMGLVPDGSTPARTLLDVQREHAWWVNAVKDFGGPTSK